MSFIWKNCSNFSIHFQQGETQRTAGYKFFTRERKENSIGSSVSLVCKQGRPRRSRRRQPDVSLVGKLLSISVQVMGCFMREWRVNIWNKFRGSYFEAKSINEVKRLHFRLGRFLSREWQYWGMLWENRMAELAPSQSKEILKARWPFNPNVSVSFF